MEANRTVLLLSSGFYRLGSFLLLSSSLAMSLLRKGGGHLCCHDLHGEEGEQTRRRVLSFRTTELPKRRSDSKASKKQSKLCLESLLDPRAPGPPPEKMVGVGARGSNHRT